MFSFIDHQSVYRNYGVSRLKAFWVILLKVLRAEYVNCDLDN